MSIIKNVLDRGKVCSRCKKVLGLRSHIPERYWGFGGKLCNECFQTVTKGIDQFNATLIHTGDAKKELEGWLFIQFFDQRNMIIFVAKMENDPDIGITQTMLRRCVIVTRDDDSLSGKILSGGGIIKAREKKYLKIEFDDGGDTKTLIFDVGNSTGDILEKISTIVEQNVKNKKQNEAPSDQNYCEICKTNLGFIKPILKDGCNSDAMLCGDCHARLLSVHRSFNIENISSSDFKKRACDICGKYISIMQIKSDYFCMPCFEKKYGKIILLKTIAEYHGGHKAFLAGGYSTKFETGSLFLTDNYLIFIKMDTSSTKRIEIVIPLSKVILEGWRIEEESRRKSVSMGTLASPSFFGLAGYSGGTVHDQGKAHHIVISYVDENDIPQEPRFGISSYKGQEIRKWSETIYSQIVKIKKDSSMSVQEQSKTNEQANKNDDPLHIAKLRFAKGEIAKEEYEEMRKMLES